MHSVGHPPSQQTPPTPSHVHSFREGRWVLRPTPSRRRLLLLAEQVWKPWRRAGAEPDPERDPRPQGTLALVQGVRALCDEAREALGTWGCEESSTLATAARYERK